MSLSFSIIIVSLNGRDRLAMPLEALRRCDPAPAEVIVVDNGSNDGTSRFVAENHPEAVLVRAPRNLGFAGGNNLGILNAGADVVLLLNDDTEPAPDFLAPLADEFQRRPDAGILGCRLLYPDGATIQHLGGIIEANGLTKHVDYGAAVGDQSVTEGFETAYATGAAMAIRRQVLRDVGLLDEGFWPIYFEEVDLCERARRAGWAVRIRPDSTVIHHESQTTRKLSAGFHEKYHRNRWRFLLKNRRGLDLARAIRAEARWMVRHTPWELIWPCSLAYAWGALQWREIRQARIREAPRGALRRRAGH